MRKLVPKGFWVLLIILALSPFVYYGGIWFFVSQPLIFKPVANNQSLIEPARLEAHVRYLSEDCFPRDYTHPEQMACAVNYITEHFTRAGGRVIDQAYDADGKIYHNVIAQFGPTSGPRVVIGAHYDVLGEIPGANDDASGIAALIEIAYLLKDANLQFPVELVAYALEEPPFYATEDMGSTVHATSLEEQGIPVRAMIAIDEIGYFSDEPDSQSLPIFPWLKKSYSDKADFIAVLAPLKNWYLVRQVKKAMVSAADLPVYAFSAPVEMERRVILGDHRSYYALGYPCVIVTDTAFLRNPVKHTEGDTPDSLDFDRMSQVVAGVYQAVLSLTD